MSNKKKPPIPEGWDPASTPIIRFLHLILAVDIDGKPYEMTIMEKSLKIVDSLSKEVIYEGPDMVSTFNGAPFGMEGGVHILHKIEKYKEAKNG